MMYVGDEQKTGRMEHSQLRYCHTTVLHSTTPPVPYLHAIAGDSTLVR